MIALSREYIRTRIADSQAVYERGKKIYRFGSYLLSHRDLKKKEFIYRMDGNYGNYTTRVAFSDDMVHTACDCPYPGDGCKHIVAAALNARDILVDQGRQEELFSPRVPEYLSDEEIRRQVLKDREYRAKTETFDLVQGE
ncbi:MAG: helicase, partial [Desulfobacteraceae bacterium]